MIIAEPGRDKAQVCSQPVGLIDLYPTLLELCGLPPRPANSGRSLVPLLRKTDTPWRHSILTTYARGNHALRSDRYRYIRYDDGSEELYDHGSDPNEWVNLASKPGNTAVLEEFHAELPLDEAPYHPAVGTGAVNAWFEDHYRKTRK